MNFAGMKDITIPEGKAVSIACGGKILWRKQKYKRELLYLESTGTQWLDSGYKINNNSEIELIINVMGSNNCNIFGSRGSKTNANQKNTSITTGTSGIYVIDYTNSNYATYRLVTTNNNNFKAKVVMSKKERSVTNLDTNQTIGINAAICKDVFTCDTNAYVLHVSGQAYFDKPTEKARLYSLKISESGKIVCDFIPVLDMNDVPCMYDKVSGKLFYNKGTGEFAYAELSGLPSVYQEVEYLEGTGTQYIDTGLDYFADFEVGIKLRENVPNKALGNGRSYCLQRQNATTGCWQFTSGNNFYNTTKKITDYHVLSWKNNMIYADEVKLSNFTKNSNDGYKMLLFAGESAACYPNIIYFCKLWDNNDLIRDFIPCYRKSDKKPGMYDLITGDFITNSGTGEFLYKEKEVA